MPNAKTIVTSPGLVSSHVPVAKGQNQRVQLKYLDGIRGLAALFVVAHHAYLEVLLTPGGQSVPHWLRLATNWLGYGHLAVAIFIVLSGYCLMLPLARDPTMPFDVARFIQRRGRRILPPYFAAVVVSLLLIAVVPGLHNGAQNTNYGIALPAFTPGVILSHLLLIHNMNGAWEYKINFSLWSVATEWQIYFVFALVLLPLWRRFGVSVTVVAAFGLGFLLDRLHPASCFHFLGLFSLGMLGALIGFSPSLSNRDDWSKFPWLAGTLGLLILLGFVSHGRADWVGTHVTQADLMAGPATLCLLISCTVRAQRVSARRPLLLRVFESRLAMHLGSFSYSLYLIHAPLLSILHLLLHPLGLTATETLFIVLGAGVPVSAGLAYLFYLTFERPFLSGQARRRRVQEQAEAK